MDWYTTVFEVIDMRSFSNLWFWIALAVVWSTASHWVLGVPFDMVARARRHGGEAETDLVDLVRINTGRLIYIADMAGLWLVALGTGMLTSLAILGWIYDVEFAQALFLLGFPMSIVGVMSLRTARRIRREATDAEDICRRLSRHRLGVQAVGMVAIFVTSMWGMYRNMSLGILGG